MTGEAHETEEMDPKWYGIDEIPYAEMWEDDPIWLPGVVAGGSVKMRFYFDPHGALERYEQIA